MQLVGKNPCSRMSDVWCLMLQPSVLEGWCLTLDSPHVQRVARSDTGRTRPPASTVPLSEGSPEDHKVALKVLHAKVSILLHSLMQKCVKLF